MREKLRRRSSAFALIMEENILGYLMLIAKNQFTPPETPQLNDIAEMMNMIIVERVSCVLSHAKLPKSYWGGALMTTVYLINRSPFFPL